MISRIPFNSTPDKYRGERKLWNSYLLFIIDKHMFLYIVFTLREYIWYEPIIILGYGFQQAECWTPESCGVPKAERRFFTFFLRPLSFPTRAPSRDRDGDGAT